MHFINIDTEEIWSNATLLSNIIFAHNAIDVVNQHHHNNNNNNH